MTIAQRKAQGRRMRAYWRARKASNASTTTTINPQVLESAFALRTVNAAVAEFTQTLHNVSKQLRAQFGYHN